MRKFKYLLLFLFLSFAAHSQTDIINSYRYGDPILEGLIGAWDFEDDGPAEDLVGTVDGTGTGGTTVETGADGNAVQVVIGDDSWIDFGDPAIYESMEAITVVIDVYPTANGGSGVSNIIGNWWSGTSQRWHLGLNSSNYIRGRIHSGTVSRDVTGTDALSLNTWHRISLRWEENATVKIKVDAHTQAASASTAVSMGAAGLGMQVSADPLLSGATNRQFSGRVDNLFIWDRQLTNDEIDQMHTGNPTYAELKGNYMWWVILLAFNRRNYKLAA